MQRKVEGIFVNPFDSIKYQILTPCICIHILNIFCVFFLGGGGIVEYMYGVTLNTQIKANFKQQKNTINSLEKKLNTHVVGYSRPSNFLVNFPSMPK